jgi:hypothetical protein
MKYIGFKHQRENKQISDNMRQAQHVAGRSLTDDNDN